MAVYNETQTRTWTRQTSDYGTYLQAEFVRINELFNFIVGNDGSAPTLTMTQLSPISTPIGCVLPFIPGYFTNGSNAGFTYLSTVYDTLSDSYKICDGSLLNDSSSSIFNGANRYLPNLTDDRFLMGNTSYGVTGGGEAHYHSLGTGSNIAIAAGGAHTHTVTGGIYGGGHGAGSTVWVASYTTTTTYTSTSSTHTHVLSGSFGATAGVNGDAAEAVKPKYLSVKYIMRVK
jgi:hypothetical protein